MTVIYFSLALALVMAGVALWLYVRAIEQDGIVQPSPAMVGAPVQTVMTAPAAAPVAPLSPPPAAFDDEEDEGGGGSISPEMLAEWAKLNEEPAPGPVVDAPRRPSQAATLYAVLGVAQDADEAALRAAYRAQAKVWHTDTNKDPQAADEFNVVREAYDVLSDPDLRAKYDAGLLIEEMDDDAA